MTAALLSTLLDAIRSLLAPIVPATASPPVTLDMPSIAWHHHLSPGYLLAMVVTLAMVAYVGRLAR